MAMDKFAVENVRKMQRDALTEVRDRLTALQRSHTKTASELDEIARLERQVRDLEDALAEQ